MKNRVFTNIAKRTIRLKVVYQQTVEMLLFKEKPGSGYTILFH